MALKEAYNWNCLFRIVNTDRLSDGPLGHILTKLDLNITMEMLCALSDCMFGDHFKTYNLFAKN